MNRERFYLWGLRKTPLVMENKKLKMTMNTMNRFFCGCGLLLGTAYSFAGFLDMPEIEEVPEYERETKLLDLDVPTVRERDPDPESGPRLNVTEFRLQGVVEYPELGITREKLIQRVEAIRFNIMEEGELTDSGYTLSELGEVSDLMAEIETQTEGRHVTPLEVQRLVFLIREQRRSRGVTLGMLENVADEITKFYREKGFILAKAYLPEQKVRDGVVVLTLLLGELGEVAIQNNKRYSDRSLRRMFNDVIGQPVTAAKMEEKIYLVNDLPGLAVQGYFEPGNQVGDSRLNINVLQERWISSNIRLDNHGSPKSGEYRTYADIYIHNPTTLQDELQLGVLFSREPGSSTYGSLRYNSHVLGARTGLTMGISTNSYVLGEANTGLGVNIEGESEVADVGISYVLRRSRTRNHLVSLTGQDIDTNLSLLISTDESTQAQIPAIQLTTAIQNIVLAYNFDILAESPRILHQGGVTLVGSTLDELGQLAGSQADEAQRTAHLNFNYTMLTFFKTPFTGSDSRLVWRVVGQYTEDSLSSVNQMNMAGPTMVRGYAVDKFYGDVGFFTGADWIFNDAFGERLSEYMQPYVFVDMAYSELIPKVVDGETITAKLSDIGLGLKFKFGRSARGSVAVISPITDKISSVAEIDQESREPKVYFDFQYSF